MAKLGDIATYINGYAFKPSDWSTEGLPIIRIQDLTGSSYKTNKYNGDYDKKYEVNNGDILISWSASLGVFVWKNDKAVLNQHIFKVIFNKKVVDKDFFVYQVENILRKAQNSVHGATMKHLTKPVFDSLDFYLPLIEEQKRIAKQLKLINLLIDHRNDQIKKLDLLVKSRFIEMFGDPITNDKELPVEPLGKHIELLGGFAFKSTGFAKEGIPVLRIGNINSGYFKSDNLPFWKYDKALDRYLLYPGDLAISLTGTVGKDDYGNICRLGNDYPRYYLNQRNAKLILKDTVLPEFIRTLLKNKKVKDKIVNTGVGIRQANISNKSILELEVPIPNLAEQKQFASLVTQVDKSKLAIQQSLYELETLKKSLMQQYFG